MDALIANAFFKVRGNMASVLLFGLIVNGVCVDISFGDGATRIGKNEHVLSHCPRV